MLMRSRRLPLLLIASLLPGARFSHAQQACQQIESARDNINITATARQQIEDCIRAELSAAQRVADDARLKTLVDRFRSHRDNPANSAAFLDALRAGTAKVAESEFARSNLDPLVGIGLARGLFELGGNDSIPAWLVGLKSNIEAVRYLSGRALATNALRNVITGNRNLTAQVTAALEQAGEAEQRASVKRQIYRAVTSLTFSPEVLDALLAMMDKELERLRGGAVRIEGAELPAFQYLAAPGVRNALTADNRTQLITRLGPLLGYNARRYASPDIAHDEGEIVERCLYFIDEVLRAAVPNGGGNIVQVLTDGGDKLMVQQEVVRWIGDPDANAKGVLNDAPHNLPLGAP